MYTYHYDAWNVRLVKRIVEHSYTNITCSNQSTTQSCLFICSNKSQGPPDQHCVSIADQDLMGGRSQGNPDGAGLGVSERVASSRPSS